MKIKFLIVVSFILLYFEIKNYKKTQNIASLFFSIGFFLYLIMPIIFLLAKELNEKSLKLYFYPYRNKIEENFIELIFLLGLIYISNLIGRKIATKKIFYFDDKISKIIVVPIFMLFFILGISIITINIKAVYLGYSFFGNFRSILASISIILMTLTIYSLLRNRKKINFYLFLTFIISFILMIMGSRMYFIANLLSYISFLECEYKLFTNNKKKGFLLAIFIFFLAGIISIKRMQSLQFSTTNLLFNNLKEFLFTSLSYLSYFSLNKIKVLTFLDKGFIIFSPFGALNIFVSLYGYFGVIGGVFLVTSFEVVMKTLSYQRNKLLKTWYYILCGGIMFMFFRDPLRIFWIKLGLEYSLMVLLFCRVMTFFSKYIYR
ncbi:O-antigen polymerase [Fusobacterium sp. HC1336]|uniref:O-antigen polymerase n=1 Tax=Fusobacterium sp. HC1336 TaxID=3171169 RepID=UPI003F28BAFB